jgi:hypothetical protein
METLKEFADFLKARGYKETKLPYCFTNGWLDSVSFSNGSFGINFNVEPTPEFGEKLNNMPDGEEYDIDYKDYVVAQAFIESPVCNVSDFFDGATKGIFLVKEPGEYVRHTLDLFEYCTSLQTTDLAEHELKILKARIAQMEWATKNLFPVLKKADYHPVYDTFFATDETRDSSNQWIELQHKNHGCIHFTTDCITGYGYLTADDVDLSCLVCHADENTVREAFLEKVWKENELRYGYLWHNDPKETVDTYLNLLEMFETTRRGRPFDKVDLSVIPDKYSDDVKLYKQILEEYEQSKKQQK